MVPSGEVEVLKFQGTIPYPIPSGKDDWGVSAEEQETKVEQFRLALVEKSAWRSDHDYFTLLRFLRARNYELPKAVQMWLEHMDWRKQNAVDDLLADFTFHEREQFLYAWPQGYHKTDKQGRPVYIQLLGKINLEQLKNVTTEERMIKFHVQEYERCIKQILPVCSHIQGHQIDQTFGILDVKGVGLSHLTGEVKRLLGIILKLDQDNYPESLGHICIINAPALFRAIWSFVKPMLNTRTQSKIQICSSNYTKELLQWIDEDSLPSWLGGKSQGTLIDDVGPWREPKFAHIIAASMKGVDAVKGPGVAVNVALEGRTKEREGIKLRTARVGADPYHSSPRSPIPVPSVYQQDDRSGSFTDADVNSSSHRTSVDGRHTSPRMHGGLQLSKPQHPLPPLNLKPTNSQGPHANGPSSSHSVSPSAASAKSKSLLERIKALEKALPDQVDRLKPYMPPDCNMSMSTRSARSTAPEGSLLYRIETLEEALEALLHAQESLCRENHPDSPQEVTLQTVQQRGTCCSTVCSLM